MNFKKDYINYVLYTIIQNEFYGARDDVRIRKILEKVISIPDTAKASFLAGKTAGLEILFKYLLYISDKIDKSQVTIFNLKDNFEYDIQNLKKICEEIKNRRDETQSASLEVKTKETVEPGVPDEEESSAEGETEKTAAPEDETEMEKEEQTFTLIENEETGNSDDEVFGLEGITRSVEMEDIEENINVPAEQEAVIQETEEPESEIDEESIIEEHVFEKLVEETAVSEEDEIITDAEAELAEKESENQPQSEGEIEVEIKSSENPEADGPYDIKEGSVTSEMYYRFETRFFEEVKILEKLFSNTEKECKGKPLKKLNEKSLQRFSEVIEISSELANLTRQLSLDLTADIFYTINLLFTKAINSPPLINPDKIKLLTTSLSLVTSLIKGEDYLGYDELVKKIEMLKTDLQQNVYSETIEIEEELSSEVPEAAEENIIQEETEPEAGAKEETEKEPVKAEPETEKIPEIEETETVPVEPAEEAIEPPAAKQYETGVQDTETVLFKMKYLVKEFEKNFNIITSPDEVFSKYEILDEIDNLNNLLRMLAKISSAVKNNDVLKLSEVSYIFLKYLKDYRMDLLDPEIGQIVKYIIFTYKMLLTNRKPEDFEILVQYLNNPVKIFTDT